VRLDTRGSETSLKIEFRWPPRHFLAEFPEQAEPHSISCPRPHLPHAAESPQKRSQAKAQKVKTHAPTTPMRGDPGLLDSLALPRCSTLGNHLPRCVTVADRRSSAGDRVCPHCLSLPSFASSAPGCRLFCALLAADTEVSPGPMDCEPLCSRHPREPLQILQWSAEGISSRIAELSDCATKLKTNGILIQESELRPNDATPFIPGFATVGVDHKQSDGGCIPVDTAESIEICRVCVFLGTKKSLVVDKHRRNDRSRHIRRDPRPHRRCLPRFEPGRAARSARTQCSWRGALGEVLLARCSLARCSWARCSWRGALGEVPLGEVLLARWLLARCSWRGALGEVLLARCSWRGAPGEVLLEGAPWRGALARCSARLLARCSGEVLLARCWRGALRGAPGEVLLARCSWRGLLGEVLARCSWRLVPGELVLQGAPGEVLLAEVLRLRGAPGEVLLAAPGLLRCSCFWKTSGLLRAYSTIANPAADPTCHRCMEGPEDLKNTGWVASPSRHLRLKKSSMRTPWTRGSDPPPLRDECPACFSLCWRPCQSWRLAPRVTCRYGDRTLRPGQSHVFEQNCARHNCTCSPGVAGSDMCKSTMIGCLESSAAAGATRLASTATVTGASGPMHCVCQRDSDGSFTFANCRTETCRDIRTGEAKQKGQQVTTNCRTERAVRNEGRCLDAASGSYVEVGAPATTERDGAVLHCTCGGTNAYVNCRSPLCKDVSGSDKKARRESDGGERRRDDIEGRYVIARPALPRVATGGVRYECTCVHGGQPGQGVQRKVGPKRVMTTMSCCSALCFCCYLILVGSASSNVQPSGPAAPAEVGNGSVSEGLNSARLSGAIKS
uniref:FtsJ domain-containing protein n=1 Tax=Macrostomum lignano TaxID=282301 RepID=A0A1I8FE79_9PLAT